jgi:hypothetical protein
MGHLIPSHDELKGVKHPNSLNFIAFPRNKSIVLTFDSRGVDHAVINPLLLGSYSLFPLADLRGIWIFSHQRRG